MSRPQGAITISQKIHPTAIVDSSASLGNNVEVGAYSIIDADVKIGDGCRISNHVTLRSGVSFENDCTVFPGAVIGEIPQDLKFKGEDSKINIGSNVTVREYVTIHRATSARGKTIIGNSCYLMAYSHVAHDCVLGKEVTLVNGVHLGGCVDIEDYAFVSGNVVIHQFTKIGRHAFIGGGYRVVQDVPPYIMAAKEPLTFTGVNLVGLKRAGFSNEVLRNLKEAYRLLYKSSLNVSQALDEIRKTLPDTEEIKNVLSFVKNSERGII
ncbi:MAG TPA: acyl-ACP--UDP-N-acetylglucosamine O-acyltransferase [Candidatus Marinimicrobia bacterium]|nr:acyl-ACP--UDP-N-acetylglucosamine O-acyltransferase [Candidatus Neomarinimicrobiota bacterium]